ncbi:DNA polymerase III subunit chi [Methylocucumis oryzae]|uniref:DNA polymerase III subunit chi n=1 Tax=Methylocucumis oryzae TaxID=1632867 RepID=UPI0023BAEC3B|nr:DNA polymerase III subunit chi [Methylocucumis oryzae]
MDWRHTLINLSTRCPMELDAVGRILEVLVQEPTVLETGRQRYRHYQQAGLAITTHTL